MTNIGSRPNLSFWPWGQKFCWSHLAHHNYVPSLSVNMPNTKEDFKSNAYSLYEYPLMNIFGISDALQRTSDCLPHTKDCSHDTHKFRWLLCWFFLFPFTKTSLLLYMFQKVLQFLWYFPHRRLYRFSRFNSTLHNVL